MDEHERAAHLGRAWDTFRRMDLDRCDPADIATVRSLIALDRLPMPDPRFVSRLETTLTGAGPAPQLLPLNWPPAQVASARVDHGDKWTRTLPAWNRFPALARWAAAGTALLLCATLTFMTLQSGRDDDGNPTSLAVYGDASAVALSWQMTPECDVPARSGDSFRSLIARSEGYSDSVPPPLGEVGVPADGATTALIEATMREILACRTARETGREYALYSDGALLRANQLAQQTYDIEMLEGLMRSAEFVANMVGTPVPVPNGEAWILQSIQDIHLLADGSFSAVVYYETGETPGTRFEGTSFVAFFVKEDGIYRIDDAEGFTYLEVATPVVESGPVSGGSATGAINIGQGPDEMGGTFGTFVTDYPAGDPPPPLPTANVKPGNTSGGAAVGGSGGFLTSQPTPGPADD